MNSAKLISLATALLLGASTVSLAQSARLNPTADVALINGAIHTMDVDGTVADEVAAIRFSHEAGVEFVPSAGLRHVEHYDLITSINALQSVWRDELSYAETVERNLVWSAEGVRKMTLSLVFASR